MQCLRPKDERPSAHDLLTSKFLNDLESEKNNHEVQLLPLIPKSTLLGQKPKRNGKCGGAGGAPKVESTIFEQENEDDNSQDEREGKRRAQNQVIRGSADEE